MITSDAFQEFAQFVAPEVEDERIDLLAASLAIARTEYRELDPQRYSEYLNGLAERVRTLVRSDSGTREVVAAINRVMFGEEAFRGNREEYYDRRNSYLNEVIDRRLGIPITLAVIYMEIARRVGFPAFGVGMPGHFLLKFYEVDGRQTLIDVYEGGRVLSSSDCQARLDAIYAGKVIFQPEFLNTVSKRQILTRMLNNLKNVYLTSRDFRRALTVIDMILMIYPRSAEEVRQRALLRYNVGQMKGAADDLDLYLNMAPDASDADDMRQLALSIRRTIIQMN